MYKLGTQAAHTRTLSSTKRYFAPTAKWMPALRVCTLGRRVLHLPRNLNRFHVCQVPQLCGKPRISWYVSYNFCICRFQHYNAKLL